MSLSQVTPTLFLSGADAALNAALVAQKGITLIVNATLSHTCPAYPGVECVRVPVCDLPSARLGDHFDRVAERIHSNRAGGTLVHCAAGMSRSPALVMAYLMRYRAVTLCQAHRWVQESRPFVRLNAGFWEQLLQYERRLYGHNTVRVAREPPPSPRPVRAPPPPSPRPVRAAPPPSPRPVWAPPPPSPRPVRAPPPPNSRLTFIPRSPVMSRSQVMMSAKKTRRGSKQL
ncbi:dual specificity protein phosphatase 18 isoform 1-T2 [Odontesthes bonariensis]|uniref:dual specificity protein phosphatase 18 n=1 Tax=Odontesthes bonariensis TaxID=219752 RepID=UPI003F58F8D3